MMFFQCLFKSVLVFSPEAVSFSVLGDKVWLFPGFVRDVLKYLQLTASLISIKLNQAAILGCSTSPWCIMEPESIGFMVDVIQAVSMSTHLLLTTVQLHLRTPLYTVSTVRSRRRDSPTQSLFTVQKNKDNLTACDRKGQSFSLTIYIMSMEAPVLFLQVQSCIVPLRDAGGHSHSDRGKGQVHQSARVQRLKPLPLSVDHQGRRRGRLLVGSLPPWSHDLGGHQLWGRRCISAMKGLIQSDRHTVLTYCHQVRMHLEMK